MELPDGGEITLVNGFNGFLETGEVVSMREEVAMVELSIHACPSVTILAVKASFNTWRGVTVSNTTPLSSM